MAVRSTSNAAPVLPVLPVLPAVIDLGRRIAALSIEHDRHEEIANSAGGVSKAETKSHANSAMDALDGQINVLRALVATMPARSMEDAAVQIAEAFLIAEDLYRNVHDLDAVEDMGRSLTNLLLSALPVIAAGAGLDPVAMQWEAEVGYLHASRFSALESVA